MGIMRNNYVVIAQLEMEQPAYNVALFLHCIIFDALKIFNGSKYSTVQTIKMLWQRLYKSSSNSQSENWTNPSEGTLSTLELNRKAKALMLMSPPFKHSRKHVIFVTANITNLEVILNTMFIVLYCYSEYTSFYMIVIIYFNCKKNVI